MTKEIKKTDFFTFQILLFDNFSAIDNHNIGDFYGLLRGLWNDPGIKEAFERRSEFHLPDSMGYFYDHLDRIIVSDYVPTQQVHTQKNLLISYILG